MNEMQPSRLAGLHDFGEAAAELAYSQLHGVGEAEAARRLPAIREALAAMARSIAGLQGATDVAEFIKEARRGFNVRASELGFLGAREA